VDELDNGVAHEAPAVGSGVQVLLLRVPGPEHTTQPLHVVEFIPHEFPIWELLYTLQGYCVFYTLFPGDITMSQFLREALSQLKIFLTNQTFKKGTFNISM